jgi:hypothetical protein
VAEKRVGADGEHRTMNAVKAPALKANLPATSTDAGALELSEGDHAVLASCDPSDDFIGLADFCTHVGALSPQPLGSPPFIVGFSSRR